MKRRIKRLSMALASFAVLFSMVLSMPYAVMAAESETIGESAIENEPDPYVPANPQKYKTKSLTLNKGLTYVKDGKEIEVTGAINTMEFCADPTCMEVDGRIYVYGTMDQRTYARRFSQDGNTPIGPSYDRTKGKVFKNTYNTKKLAVFSSADMVNWTDEGYIDMQEVPSDKGGTAAAKWAGNSWAPSALKYDCDGDGKDEYYLFFTNGGVVGYIKGETPLGPWKEELGGPLIVKEQIPDGKGNGIIWNFDPTVFVDDDGQAYVYWGGGANENDPDAAQYPKTSRACKMKFYPDRVEMDWDSITELNAYYMFEDSEINKFQGKYVYSYCTNHKVPDGDSYVDGALSINAYVSDDPLKVTSDPANAQNGDPAFIGTILKNPSAELYNEWYNNHHHMFEFKGKYYVLYHTVSLDQFLYKDFYAAAGRKGALDYRNLHIDEIKVDVGGDNPSITIQPTYEGPAQVQNFDPYQVVNATTHATQGGLTRAVLEDGTVVLDEIDTGDWTKISGVDLGNGASSFNTVLSSPTKKGSVEVYLDKPLTGTKIATVPLKKTGENVFKTVSVALNANEAKGVHDVYFVFRGSGYQVASWEFSTSPAIEDTEPEDPDDDDDDEEEAPSETADSEKETMESAKPSDSEITTPSASDSESNGGSKNTAVVAAVVVVVLLLIGAGVFLVMKKK